MRRAMPRRSLLIWVSRPACSLGSCCGSKMVLGILVEGGLAPSVAGRLLARPPHRLGPSAILCSNICAQSLAAEHSLLPRSDNTHCEHRWFDHNKHTHTLRRPASPARTSESLSQECVLAACSLPIALARPLTRQALTSAGTGTAIHSSPRCIVSRISTP